VARSWARTLEELASDYSEKAPPAFIDWTLDSSEKAGLIFSISGIRHRIRAPRILCRLPLAPVVGPHLRLPTLVADARAMGAMDEIAEMAYDWITNDTLANAHSDTGVDVVSRGFTEEDIAAAGVFLCEDEDVMGLSAFKVEKKLAVDARFVTNCAPANESIRIYIPKMRIPYILNLIGDMLKYKWGWEADGRSWFYQIPICIALGKRYGVRLAAKRGRFRRFRHKSVPMGSSWAPFVAQEVARLLCRIALMEAELRGVTDAVLVPWIDNFICLANSESDAAILKEVFMTACDRYNVIIKEEPSVSQRLTILGLFVDLENGSISPTVDTVHRLGEALETVCQTPTDISLRSFLQIFGIAGWTNFTILRAPLCFYPETMDTLRKVCGLGQTDGWDTTICVPNDTWAELKRWLQALMTSTWTEQSAEANPNMDISWSDANDNLIAILLQQGDEDSDSEVRPVGNTDIFLSELWGMAWGALTWQAPNSDLLLAGDNTPAVAAFTKGHSSSRAGDRILRTAFTHLLPSSRLWTTWVPSDLQRADPLTRPGDPWRSPHRTLGRLERVRWRIPA